VHKKCVKYWTTSENQACGNNVRYQALNMTIILRQAYSLEQNDSAEKANNPEPEQWQSLLANAITDPKLLFSKLALDPQQLPAAFQASKDFSLRVPLPFLEKIKLGDPTDPLLLQILPVHQESEVTPGYSQDPLQEDEFSPAQGLLHKYEGRALLIVSPVCAVNCRYCFRRHFPYQEHQSSADKWQEAISYIRKTPSISEIILSGGDPLAINNKRLQQLIQQLDNIPHLTRLRIHTRFPVVIPQRIDQPLIQMLSQSRLQIVMVIHANHRNELDSTLGKKLRELQSIGVTLLNQSVLLKSVNDNVDALSQLSEELFKYNVLPYYLHILDSVQGAAHFQVSKQCAIKLMEGLRAKLPGYLVPKLVEEQAFAPNKVPV